MEEEEEDDDDEEEEVGGFSYELSSLLFSLLYPAFCRFNRVKARTSLYFIKVHEKMEGGRVLLLLLLLILLLLIYIYIKSKHKFVNDLIKQYANVSDLIEYIKIYIPI